MFVSERDKPGCGRRSDGNVLSRLGLDDRSGSAVHLRQRYAFEEESFACSCFDDSADTVVDVPRERQEPL